MQSCERCGAKANGKYELFDYCAQCSRNLCDACMDKGCCGAKPAKSGMNADATEADQSARKPAPSNTN